MCRNVTSYVARTRNENSCEAKVRNEKHCVANISNEKSYVGKGEVVLQSKEAEKV